MLNYTICIYANQKIKLCVYKSLKYNSSTFMLSNWFSSLYITIHRAVTQRKLKDHLVSNPLMIPPDHLNE